MVNEWWITEADDLYYLDNFDGKNQDDFRKRVEAIVAESARQEQERIRERIQTLWPIASKQEPLVSILKDGDLWR